jgi:hypothetical protein
MQQKLKVAAAASLLGKRTLTKSKSPPPDLPQLGRRRNITITSPCEIKPRRGVFFRRTCKMVKMRILFADVKQNDYLCTQILTNRKLTI